MILINILNERRACVTLKDYFRGILGKKCDFGEYVNKKSGEESGISKLGKNTLQGLLIITDVINIHEIDT